MQNLLKISLIAAMAFVYTAGHAQPAQQHTVCEGEPVTFALMNAPDTRIVWEYSADGEVWSISDMTDGMQPEAHTGMNGYYRAKYWDETCIAYQYSPVQQLTVRPFAESLVLQTMTYSGGVLLTVEGRKALKEVEYVINDEVVPGKTKGFHLPADRLPAMVYARNPENCEQTPLQLITLPAAGAKCNVAGGTISTSDPRFNLCLNEGPKTIQFNVTGNVGAGRFVLVQSGTLELVASNTTGLFTMNSYPPGSYIAAHVSLTTTQEFIGISNPTQLPACHSLSNQLPVTTLSVSGGIITANGPTTVGGGSVSFSVSESIGPNKRWVLLNQQGNQVLDINTTGVFFFASNNPGTYRVVHIAYGPGVNLALVNPQNLQGCIAASNFILVKVLDCPSSVTFTYKGETVTYGTVISSGGCWLDRNLGAEQVATSNFDQSAYGDLFQWGRGDDGHQNRTSPTSTTLSTADQPMHGDFILAPSGPFDWRTPPNDNLWQGVNGINNPCPEGFRVPTADEWNQEKQSWSSQNSSGAFNSPLKLTAGGYRGASLGNLRDVGFRGGYWSSTVSTTTGTQIIRLNYISNNANTVQDRRANGHSVRCIKDILMEGSLSSIDCSSATHTGYLTQEVNASGVNSTVPYTGGNGGTYDGQTVASTGVVGLTATLQPGFFANGSGSLTYSITGTPSGAGTASFAINIGGLSCTLTRTVNTPLPDCPSSVTFTYKGETVTYGTVISTGRCWLDRNLGATQVATHPTNHAASRGDLFQWGRGDDGHQNRTSPTTSTLSSTDQPLHGSFIQSTGAPYDWRSPKNDNLWQGVNGINNPCPEGFRVPTEAEWNQERLNWTINTTDGAFDSPLKLTAAGGRIFDGTLVCCSSGSYWSSTVLGTDASALIISGFGNATGENRRAIGSSVRCIKD